MNVLKSIGVMQGRLLPKYKGKYQAHPKGYWQNEFKIAKSIGISHIQFLFDNEKLIKLLITLPSFIFNLGP